MMIIQGIIEFGYNICSAWFLDIRISTCFSINYSFVDEIFEVKQKFSNASQLVGY